MKRRPLLLLVGLLVALGLVAAACGDDSDDTSSTSSPAAGTPTSANAEGSIPDGPEISIGAQDFSESRVLAQLYAQALEAGGYKASVVELGTDAYRDIELQAFSQGKINMAPEYAASMLEAVNGKKGEATSDAKATTDKLNTYLEGKQLLALTPTQAVDTNGFVVTGETSSQNGIKTLSDLAAKGKEFKLGAPTDCESNGFCLPGLKTTYGLDLTANFTALDSGLIPAALESGDIDVGVIFTTNPIIQQKGWVLLEDDKGMLAADNIVPVISTSLRDTYGEDFTNKVDAIGKDLTTEELTTLVGKVDLDKSDPDVVAKEWLKDHGLA
jgi:osmoprotectant transport system substrate-binding protein